MHNEGSPRYAGPRALADALTAFARAGATDAAWDREGLRDDVESRDLGLAAATGGRIGAKHIRALKPLPAPTGWHWHDMTAHYVYVLRGSLEVHFASGDVVRLARGDTLYFDSRIPHAYVCTSKAPATTVGACTGDGRLMKLARERASSRRGR